MPWADDHKERTRERIVDAAAAALRAKGIDGVSIAEIMAEAGLTHGGFYAHFDSKEDLLRAALERAGSQTIDTLSATTRSLPAGQRIDAVIDTYLSSKHAAHPERGCPLAALASELGRAAAPVQGDVARGIERRAAWLQDLLPQDPGSESDAIGIFACMVGGLVLARAAGAERSDAILEATRAFVHGALEAKTRREAAIQRGATGRRPSPRSKRR